MTGPGWKPVEHYRLAGSTPAPSAELLATRSVSQHGVRGVAVSARLPVKQEVRVQLPSVTLLICRRGSTEKDAGLVNRMMLVRIQSSDLCPDGVTERIEPS